MVSPSKSKLSKNASQQQQQQQQQEQPTPQSSHRKSANSSSKKADKNTNKVKLVKGPKPLIYHRFYLDIERHQVATKIETTIKELGGSIEFFLNKDITHFITDKHQQASGSLPITTSAAAGTGERYDEHHPSPSGVSSLARRFGPASPAAVNSPDTPILGTRNRQQLQQQSVRARHHSLHPTHQQNPYGQYVNDYGPATSRTSSPCPTPTITTTSTASSSAVCSSGAVRSVQQTVATGEVATFSSTAPVSPVTAGLDGKGKSTQPANTSTAQVLPRNRADAMLQRVRQQHHQQQQYQSATPHHLLHSSPLNPPVYVHGTPTKSETPLGTPPSFHSSSHHKPPNPASPCYSPAGGGSVGPSRQPKQPRQNSPVQLARSWGIPVWSAEQALKFLRKVLDSVQNENRNRSTSLARTAEGNRGNKSGLLDGGGGRLHHHHRGHHHRRHNHVPHQHVHHLRGQFIKIECLSNPDNFRPIYQEFKQWPILLTAAEDYSLKKAPFADANQPPGQAKETTVGVGGNGGGKKTATINAATQNTTAVEEDDPATGCGRMTRKLLSNTTATTTPLGNEGGDQGGVVKQRQKSEKAVPPPPQTQQQQPPRDCGYCEICRIEYDSLAVHVQSESHRAFVENDDNFLSLDRLFGSIGSGGGAFGGGLFDEKNDEGGGAVGAAAGVAPSFGNFGTFPGEGKSPKAGGKKQTSSKTVTVTQQQQLNEGEVDVKDKAKEQQQVKGENSTINQTFADEQKVSEGEKGKKKEGGDGVNLNDTQELIKLALASTVAYFESGSSDRGKSERTSTGGKKDSKRSRTVVEDSDSKRINSSLVGGDSEILPQEVSAVVVEEKTRKRGRPFGKRSEGIAGDIIRVIGRVSRSSAAAGAALASSTTAVEEEAEEGNDNVKPSLLQTEQKQEERKGMFGRRSAIHHHPHNQLNHHNHQKHKSTLSALLLKQQRERELQQEQVEKKEQPLTREDEEEEEEKNQDKPGTDTSSDSRRNLIDDDYHHAVGMKVITNFRTEQEELVADKSALVVSPPKLTTGGVDGLRKEEETATPTTAAVANKRRKRRGLATSTTTTTTTELDTEGNELLAMGQKTSTTAMNKHHHHHHHHHHLHHPNDDDGGVGAGLVVGTKTRHTTAEVHHHHHLLECEGLDPKNTKRISLGLRQNPKRANLNEDFTSLLDETLERSKMASTMAATTGGATGGGTSARKAQSRVRQKQHGGVGKSPVKEEGGSKGGDVERRLHHTNSGCEEEKESDDVELELAEANERLGKTNHQRKVDNSPGAGSKARSRPAVGGKKSASAAALEDIKVRGIRWRAPSPTTRPPVKSPLLYKVIEQSPATPAPEANSSRIAVTNKKSSVSVANATVSNTSTTAADLQCPNNSITSQRRSSKSGKGASPKKNGLIVKIRRVRQSELSLLNDEAENFMFPRKDDSSSEVDTDDDRQTSSEGYRAAVCGGLGDGIAGNNYSIDLPSSSEGERAKVEEAEVEKEEEEEDTPVSGGGRKRKKGQSVKHGRECSMESEPSSSSVPGSPTIAPPTAKRQKLDEDKPPASRRKGGSQTTSSTADYDKCQEPAGSRPRFPEAPIQPGPVAAAALSSAKEHQRTRRRRSPSVAVAVPEDDDERSAVAADEHEREETREDDDVDEVEEEVEKEVEIKQVRKPGRGRGRWKKVDQERTISSTTAKPTSACSSCSCGVTRRGRGAGRRGRGRGRGAVSYRGGRGRKLASAGGVCRCQLLDATRMPPPSGTIDAAGGWRRNSEDDGSSSSTSSSYQPTTTPGRRKGAGSSRASKTKTTPPAARREQSPSSSASSASTCDIVSSSSSSYASTASSCAVGKGKEDGMGAVFKWINFRKRCEEIEPYRFAFERVPSLEPWYETFQRQDDGTEKVYEYFGSTGYRKLPYEMGPLPALGQNCCILNYKVVACRKSNRTASLQSCSSSSMEPPSPGKRTSGSRPSSADTAQHHHPGTTSTASTGDTEAKKSSPSSSSSSSLPLKKRKLLLQQDAAAASSAGSGAGTSGDAGEGSSERSSHGSRISRLIAGVNERPRKSPREHASTLAILSLLQQQQHRKRAAAIKILTSPKKATTATATQTSAFLDHHQFTAQDGDIGDELSRRSSSRASERGASSGGGGIKFERPLFPDSGYVNSRTLCQEMDAFLTEELNRVAGERRTSSTTSAVKKEEPEEVRLREDLQQQQEDEKQKEVDQLLEEISDDEPILLPPSVAHEGIAIERDNLPVSKRDLLDVLQTVGSEPPLSLKLVQRCESVVKKIVQYDRKTRPMLSSGAGAGGLGISSISSTPIGLQLFDSGSMLAACAGSGAGGPGSGGSFLKKRINRTGWPTNKRKIGTRTRLQARFMVPTGVLLKSVSSESIKKEPTEEVDGGGIEEEEDDDGEEDDEEEEDDDDDEEEEEEDEVKTDDDSHERRRRGHRKAPRRKTRDPDDEDDDDDEDDVEEDEEEGDDDSGTVVEVANKSKHHHPSRRKKKEPSHEKTERRRKSTREEEHCEALEEEHGTTEKPNTCPPEEAAGRGRRRCISSKSEDSTKLVCKDDEEEEAAAPPRESNENDESDGKVPMTKERKKKEESKRILDSMPTLRAALMRDNSQLQRHLSVPSSSSSPLLAAAILAPPKMSSGPVVDAPPEDTTAIVRGGPAAVVTSSCRISSGCSSLCPTSTGQPSVVGSSCCKYVTKTTTTMTRVDYDGGANSGISSVAATGGKPSGGRKSRERAEIGVVDVARLGEWSSVEGNSAANRTNRPPRSLAGGVGTTSVSAGTTNHAQSTCATEDDDKECDSISSRSIFVSDDCDTTSSSTVLNAPDDGGGLPPQLEPTTPSSSSGGGDVKKCIISQPNDCGESSEHDEIVRNDTAPHEAIATSTVKSKTPRTPSERIRNKMVQKRSRNANKVSREKVDTIEKPSLQETAKSNSHSRRRSSSSVLAPPAPTQSQFPPPTMMPLSPPLTTSTSSSSSSSCGVDDKPMSPMVVAECKHDDEADDDHDDHHGSSTRPAVEDEQLPPINNTSLLIPSKIKTRSSTFGRSPAKRTYGRAKVVTPVKYPYVALVRTSFLPKGGDPVDVNEQQQEISVVPSPAPSPTIMSSSKRKRRRKAAESDASLVPKVPTKRKSKASVKVSKVKHAMIARKPKQPSKQSKNIDLSDGNNVEEAIEDGGKKKRKGSSTVVSIHHVAVTPKAPRKQELKIKVFNHGSGHFKSVSSVTFENDEDEEQHHEGANLDPLAMLGGSIHSLDEDPEQEEKDTQVELMEEHLIEEEGEVEEDEHEEDHHDYSEQHEQDVDEAQEEEEEEEELEHHHGIVEEEEEHIEMLELMEVDEEELNRQHEQAGDDSGEDDHEEEMEKEEQEEAFLTGDEADHDDEYPARHHDNHDEEEEQRKLMMLDHDYGNHRHQRSMMEESEFVEVEELEEDLEELEEEEEEEEEDDVDSTEDGHHQHASDNLEFELHGVDMEQRLPAGKATPSVAGTSSAVVTSPTVAPRSSGTSTNLTNTAATANSSNTSPTKYSPRKLRKPRGRWYRER
ncbi:uncharacterized protein LOC131285881 [Anopheles ziemanni]|uniref:uncharacterized protein LOC131285881 n=1 Tax=Anopheles ziemanni TaxID=345580 RepID=UPI00265F9CF8|nr:uncharacterized protein LOC131285881 [Anopheles ziemanni]